MKLGVYSVMHNNISNVPQWWHSAQQVQHVSVLCVNSEDGTSKYLKQLGAHVVDVHHDNLYDHECRNMALSGLDNQMDICVYLPPNTCMHPDWRTWCQQHWDAQHLVLETQIQQKDRMMRWQLCNTSAVHARHTVTWRGLGRPKLNCAPDQILHRDHTLFHSDECERYNVHQLQQAVQLHKSSTNVLLLARELALQGDCVPAQELLEYHVTTFRHCSFESGEALMWLSILQPHRAEQWLTEACARAPQRRESFFYLAHWHVNQQQWQPVLDACIQGTSIARKPLHWLDDDQAYSTQMYIWGAQASLQLNLPAHAQEFASKGLELEPWNTHLQELLAKCS